MPDFKAEFTDLSLYFLHGPFPAQEHCRIFDCISKLYRNRKLAKVHFGPRLAVVKVADISHGQPTRSAPVGC